VAAALHQILTCLTQGADPATIATQFLPGGSFANGGAMRIAPVGLAYHNADAATLQAAVEAALQCTHVHPLGVEGAVAQASSGQRRNAAEHRTCRAVDSLHRPCKHSRFYTRGAIGLY
jgi:ADP-ribosylglycohydrolase